MLRSLHWRLLVAAAAAILLALCLAWMFMTLLFERHLERRLESELVRDGLRLVAALSLAPDGSPAIDPVPADPRLQTPAGGYYWQVSTAAGTVRSRSLWDADLPAPVEVIPGDWKLRDAQGPFGERVSILERTVRPDATGPQVLVQLAQDRKPLAIARGEFGRELALFLFVLWLALSSAAWLQVHLGLRPLRRVRGDLGAMQANARMRLPEARLREIQPLTDAINALADARERDLELARRRAGDLAHGLKTPLSAIAAQSRRAREHGATQAADGLDRAIAAIRRTIDAELARARAATIRGMRGGNADVRTVVERLVTVIEHTDQGGNLAFTVDVPATLRLAMQPEDLSEILGAVLENAARHARRQVRVTGTAGPQWATVCIEDDGPGFDPDRIPELPERGLRLDESGPGHGLGLSIARELAEATGGRLALSSSPLGGAMVRLEWCSS
jgi:signal transduction histidine kinase